jgi:hypothetical protein
VTLPDLSDGFSSTAPVYSGNPPAHYGKPNMNGVWDRVKSGGAARERCLQPPFIAGLSFEPAIRTKKTADV